MVLVMIVSINIIIAHNYYFVIWNKNHMLDNTIQEAVSLPPDVFPVKREFTPSLFLSILLGYARHRRASVQRAR